MKASDRHRDVLLVVSGAAMGVAAGIVFWKMLRLSEEDPKGRQVRRLTRGRGPLTLALLVLFASKCLWLRALGRYWTKLTAVQVDCHSLRLLFPHCPSAGD